MSERKIVWNKLKNNIGNSNLDIERQEILDEEIDDDEDEDEEDEDEDKEDVSFNEKPNLPKPMFAIDFADIWVMNTNFNITNSMIEKIDSIDGVEYVKPQTRYKCLIGFGKLFDIDIVKSAINRAFTEYGKYNRCSKALVLKKLKDEYGDNIRILKMPNGFLKCEEIFLQEKISV